MITLVSELHLYSPLVFSFTTQLFDYWPLSSLGIINKANDELELSEKNVSVNLCGSYSCFIFCLCFLFFFSLNTLKLLTSVKYQALLSVLETIFKTGGVKEHASDGKVTCPLLTVPSATA